MTLLIIIIGAGGHASVVADALLTAGERVLGFTDPDLALQGRMRCGLTVLGDDGFLDAHTTDSVVLANGIGGLGRLDARRAAQLKLQSCGWRFASVRHPSAIVSTFARIGVGAQVLAACVVQAGVEIGDGCILNTAAVIEHDVRLGEWGHVAPGAVVCGDVVIGARCHIGAGAVLRQGVHVGDDTIVGAGAVVVEDFLGGGLLVGVPARASRGRV